MKEKKIDITDRRKEENLFSREWAERVMLGLQIFQEFIDTRLLQIWNENFSILIAPPLQIGQECWIFILWFVYMDVLYIGDSCFFILWTTMTMSEKSVAVIWNKDPDGKNSFWRSWEETSFFFVWYFGLEYQ